MHPSENAKCATAFFRRAVKWFESLGIDCKRVLSDNAKCYGSKAFTDLCDSKDIKQSFTRPYTLQTNGKAERFIQTLLREWAYRFPYRSSRRRAHRLIRYLHFYNCHRMHQALNGLPPASRAPRLNNVMEMHT